jgi:hypothetical protein
MKKIIWLTIFCFAAALNVFGQAKEITRERYYQPFREALKKGNEITRRNLTRRENYADGKLSSTEEFINEFVKPDKRRYVHIEKFADRTSKVELIQIGETYYCRRDDGAWKQSGRTWCGDGSGNGGISNIASSKFTVEETKLKDQTVKFYHQYTTYKNTYSPDKDKEGLSYWDSKYWLNNDGLIIREESADGLLQPERIYWKQTETYEYDPKDLKIEAPIKP